MEHAALKQRRAGASIYATATVSGVPREGAVVYSGRKAGNIRSASILVGVVVAKSAVVDRQRPAGDVETSTVDGVVVSSGRATGGKAIGVA